MPKHVQGKIDGLRGRVQGIGNLVEAAIDKAVFALVERDKNLAETVIRDDEVIDRLEVGIEREVLQILALYQPVAADLRFVVAVLKINGDLERMGDLAKNIAKRVMYLADGERFEPPVDFRAMAAKVQSMARQSLDALVHSDAALARNVCQQDDEVDAMRRSIQEQIEQQIALHPDRTEWLLRLVSVSRHLERLADMATHVAEEVIRMVEGAIVRHHRLNPAC